MLDLVYILSFEIGYGLSYNSIFSIFRRKSILVVRRILISKMSN